MNVGAMTIVGSLDAGLVGDFDMLYTKSLLDFVARHYDGTRSEWAYTVRPHSRSCSKEPSFQTAGFVAPFASDVLISELTTCGSIMILALGFDLVDLTKFKVLNYLPALIVVPFALWAFQAAGLA